MMSEFVKKKKKEKVQMDCAKNAEYKHVGTSFISENAKLSTETSLSSIVLGSNKFLGYSPGSRFPQKRLSL